VKRPATGHGLGMRRSGRRSGRPMPFIAPSGTLAERGQQAVAGPEALVGHQARDEHADLGQDSGAVYGPEGDELLGRSVVGPNVAVRSVQMRARGIAGRSRLRASHSQARTS
jgi:hypothetical protein